MTIAMDSVTPRGARDGWVDFRAIKDTVSLEQVLVRYGVKLSPRGDSLVGYCPLHKGQRNSNAFHVNPGKNAWKCFGDCRAGGNQLDFVMRMEGVDLRQAAILLRQWFDDEGAPPSADTRTRASLREHEAEMPPLSFKLSLDARHPYLASRGLSKDTIETFGLGYCSKGLLEGRIAIPIHDQRGQLVAYAGRATDPALAEREGKYRFPSHFRKSQVVYNLARVRPLARSHGLVIVEGFFSVFHLHQAGIQNVVALMGSAMSETQEQLVLEAVGPGGKVSLMLDRDEAGRAATKDLLQRLVTKIHVRVIEYDADQPDGLAASAINQVFSSLVNLEEHKHTILNGELLNIGVRSRGDGGR